MLPVSLAENNPAVTSAAATPMAKIDLSKVTYQSLSPMERLTDQASVSVDFVDADHLLFTFNNKKLFKRHPECPPAHGDRLVHAAVLEISTSKVVKEVDWYLHDHSRYLWSLGNGHFLLRKLNSLYIVDSSLQETVLPIFPADLLWVSVTPDGKQIVIESTDEENPGR